MKKKRVVFLLNSMQIPS